MLGLFWQGGMGRLYNINTRACSSLQEALRDTKIQDKHILTLHLPLAMCQQKGPGSCC